MPAGYNTPHAPAPPAAASAATAQPKQPGMLAQMAATAGSVAVGSTIGHGLSSMIFGGSSNSSTPVEAQAPPVQQQQGYQAAGLCEDKARGPSFVFVQFCLLKELCRVLEMLGEGRSSLVQLVPRPAEGRMSNIIS